MAKQDEWVRMTLRLPKGLHERLIDVVAEGPASLNAEIVSRIQSTFDNSKSSADNALKGVLKDQGVLTAHIALEEVLSFAKLSEGDLPLHLQRLIRNVRHLRNIIAHGYSHDEIDPDQLELGETDE